MKHHREREAVVALLADRLDRGGAHARLARERVRSRGKALPVGQRGHVGDCRGPLESAAPASVETRSFYHAAQRDRATFLETSEESGGERTLVELEVAPGGGNTLHRHLAFSERFEVLEGELTVHVDGQDVVLRPGDSATAPIGSLHHFANRTGEKVTATVELRPGSLGFERAIQIAYGLAEDGRVNKNGVPRNLMHLGLLAEMADSQLSGVLRLIEPALRALARRARRKGVDRELIARYCSW